MINEFDGRSTNAIDAGLGTRLPKEKPAIRRAVPYLLTMGEGFHPRTSKPYGGVDKPRACICQGIRA